VCATSDQYCRQGFDRVNLGQLLDQIRIQLVDISVVGKQFYNRHERQVPKKDKSMGAFGTPIQVLRIIPALANCLYD
jgi:hypothetical protein